jgi:DNA-binding CsgD family transcriptional regulator
MNEDELIAQCYEAAAQRLPWANALHALAERLDCLLVQIIGVDLQRGQLSFSFEGGNPMPGGALEYARRFHTIDPHVQAILGEPVGSPVSFSRVFDKRFVDHNPFYQQFLIPYGVRHMHGARLYQDAQTGVMLGLHRAVGRDPIDGDDWQYVRQLCFHLVRAVAIYITTRRTSTEAAFGRATLDRIGVPLLLLDRHFGIAQRNHAADVFLKTSGVLAERQDARLVCQDLGNSEALLQAVVDLLHGPSGGAPKPVRPPRAIVSLRPQGPARPIVACLVPIRAAETMGAFGAADLLMLMIHDCNQSVCPDPYVLSAAFDFTPTEARVASALVEGLSPKEIAQRHGVSLNTVQTQVRSVLSKAGTNRTAELVSLLGTLAARTG